MTTETMPSHLLPIRLWGAKGPNPPKVGIILEELGLPYEIVTHPISDVKKPDHTRLNPNGWLPPIEDQHWSDSIGIRRNRRVSNRTI